MSEATAPRTRIKELEVMVADVVSETYDTATLVFFTGNDRLDYKAGHFLTIDPHQFEALERFTAFLEDLKGKKEPPRAYSMVSAPHERHLAVTVKEERYASGQTKYPPLLSPLLVKHMGRGMRLSVTGFTGPYTLPEDIEAKTDHLVHLCAGSGSVPNVSILKHALEFHPRLRHTFIYSNKTWEDVIFLRSLEDLQAQHRDRLRVVHALTREKDPGRQPGEARPGRVSAALLKELIPDPTGCIVYACGPAISAWDRQAARAAGTEPAPRFMESVLAALKEIGVPNDRIKRESYG
jgi:ferredoxin-NADP reductase